MDNWDVPKDTYEIIIATQCLQYLFDRAIPRLEELMVALKPGGILVYSGNIKPHFETDPPLKFITKPELEQLFQNWKKYSLGKEERLIKENDIRGYVWIVAQKPKTSR